MLAPAAGWLQLPKPLVHVESHTPPLQLRTATPLLAQARPQPPQWSTLLARSASQPSVLGAVVLQSAKPVVQPEYWQLPSLQLAPTEWFASHTLPQPPQLLVVVVVVSQPLVGSPSQSPSPAGQSS